MFVGGCVVGSARNPCVEVRPSVNVSEYDGVSMKLMGKLSWQSDSSALSLNPCQAVGC